VTARHAASTTTPLTLDGEHGTLTVARDTADQVAFVDLRLGRHGSTTGGLADALSAALTLALRHGAPADLLLGRRVDAPAIPAPRPTGNAATRPPHTPALHAALTAQLTAAR
jgi:hypothetical protein